MTSKTAYHLKRKQRHEKIRAESGVRFHIKIGPPALFRRVRDILPTPSRLEISKHARERIEERAQGEISEVMLEEIRNFDPAVWQIFSISCGSKGRIRQTSWRVKIRGRAWVVILGYQSQLVTAYPAGLENPRARKYAKKTDPFYKAVEELNAYFLDGGIPPNGTDEKSLKLQEQCEAVFSRCNRKPGN